MRLFLCFLLIFCGFSLSTWAAPVTRIQITKSVKEDPSIYFSGVKGHPELTLQMNNFLRVCGWFAISNSKDADYQLDGSFDGSGVKISLSMSGMPIGAWQAAVKSTPRKVAKQLVDAIIEKSFKALKVKGFCQSRILFCAQTANGIRNIYSCDIDGQQVTQHTSFPSLCVEPAWMPHGQSIVYSKYRHGGMDIIESTIAVPQKSRILSSFKGINAGASVSPNCKYMALILSPDHQVDLYIMNLQTRKLLRLTRSKAVEASPCWSPDGNQLAYVSDETGVPRVYIVNLRNYKRSILPSIGVDAVTPDWSSDNKIVYASRIGGAYTVGVFDTITGKNSQVTKEKGKWESPAWAADNRQVVCKRQVAGYSELWVIDTWTGRARQLLRTNYPLSMPVWSPCLAK